MTARGRGRYSATVEVNAPRSWVEEELVRYTWANRWIVNDRVYSGWVAPVGKDKDFDKACTDRNLTRFFREHTKGKQTIEYWYIRESWFFILTTQIVHTRKLDADMNNRHGIAYARMDQGAGDSNAHVVAFDESMIDAGYDRPIHFTLKRRAVYAYLFPELMRHAVALDSLRLLLRQPEAPAYFDVSVPLLCGEPETWTAKNGESGTSVSLKRNAAPDKPDRDYIAAHYIGTKARQHIIPIIEEPGEDGLTLMDRVIDWSIETSQRIFDSVPDASDDSTEGAPAEARSYLAGRPATVPANGPPSRPTASRQAPPPPPSYQEADPDEDIPF